MYFPKLLNFALCLLFMKKNIVARQGEPTPEECTRFDGVYVFDPLLTIATKTCDRGEFEHIYPDIMYQFRGIVYYARRTQDMYIIYNFTDAVTMGPLGDPEFQTSAQLWNFCPEYNDTATFITSYDDVHLYIYFEKPNTMIEVTFEPNVQWREVSARVYNHCTEKAKLIYYEFSYTSLRQVYSVREPRVVFLARNGKFIRCEWNDGKLLFVNSTTSKVGTCPRGRIHFIDESGKYFQLNEDITENENETRQDLVRSLRKAIIAKPGLAVPLGGYTSLNRNSLVKFVRHDCERYSKYGRLFRGYDWSNIASLIKLMRRDKIEQTWLQVYNINTTNSTFCKDATMSCCLNLVQAVRLLANDTLTDLCTRFTLCRVAVTREGALCPTVKCNNYETIAQLLSDGETMTCEIPLEVDHDPPCSPVFTEWKTVVRQIRYLNISDAMSIFHTVTASTQKGLTNDSESLGLGTLTESLLALETVNVTALSIEGSKKLISDIAFIADTVFDEKYSEHWLEGHKKTKQPTMNGGNSSISDPPDKSPSSPLKVLLTIDHLLVNIVSSRLHKSDEPMLSMELHKKNMAIKIGNIATYEGNMGVRFNKSMYTGDERASFIISKFPNIMNVLSRLDELIEDEAFGEKTSSHEDPKYLLHSPIVSVSFLSQNQSSTTAFDFDLSYNATDIATLRKTPSKYYFSCRFLSEYAIDRSQSWESSGCEISEVDHLNNVVRCSCNHTTNFAILLQPVPPKINKDLLASLSFISCVGESISCFCLFVTLVIFIRFRQRLQSPRMNAHFHLVISLIVLHVTQLLSVFAEDVKNSNAVPCIAVAFLTHFALLASFGWMCVEGLLLYMSVVDVFSDERHAQNFQYLIGWGAPVIISGLTLVFGLTRWDTFPTCYLEGVGEMSCTTDSLANPDAEPSSQLIEWCWLSSSSGIIWTMIVPALLVLMVNSIIISRVSAIIAKSAKSANMYRPTTEQRKERHIRKCVRGVAILMPILGLPWIFGFIPAEASHVSVLYVFAILNSTQGFFIFLFQCVNNGEVRAAIARRISMNRLLLSQSLSGDGTRRHPREEEFL